METTELVVAMHAAFISIARLHARQDAMTDVLTKLPPRFSEAFSEDIIDGLFRKQLREVAVSLRKIAASCGSAALVQVATLVEDSAPRLN